MSTKLQNKTKGMIMFIIIVSFMNAPRNVYAEIDLREYQHGIDFVALPNGKYKLFWSSGGNPPISPANEWIHDIYYSDIDPNNPKINPVTIISDKNTAQEPASAAINDTGNIMITMEDAWNTNKEVAQRFGIYDSNMKPVKPYPQMVYDGGHSGHVTTVGNQFVVFYSDGWVNGGGVDNLGSGDDVIAKVFNQVGKLQRTTKVAVDSSTRDWWPLAAGSSNKAMLVWQRFVDGKIYANLQISLLDPTTGKLTNFPAPLVKKVKYYTYNVSYIPGIERFLITGTYQSGGGFGVLLDTSGKEVARNNNLPEVVREAQIIVQPKNSSQLNAIIAQASAPTGLMVLSLTKDGIEIKQKINDNYKWQYMGVDGIFTSTNKLYMVALSDKGLVEKYFTIDLPSTPAPAPAPAPAPDQELIKKSWDNYKIPEIKGKAELEFDMTPLQTRMNGLTGLSDGKASTFSDLGVIVRLNRKGFFDAIRSGGRPLYKADAKISYEANKTYHVRMQINILEHTYSVWVTEPGNSEIQLASDYRFRKEQLGVKTLNNVARYAGKGSYTIANIQFHQLVEKPPESSDNSNNKTLGELLKKIELLGLDKIKLIQEYNRLKSNE